MKGNSIGSPDSERVFDCNLVLLAMGFLGPEKAIIDQLDLKSDPRGNINTPTGRYQTSIPKVYAAGGSLEICHLGSIELIGWQIRLQKGPIAGGACH